MSTYCILLLFIIYRNTLMTKSQWRDQYSAKGCGGGGGKYFRDPQFTFFTENVGITP